MAKGGEKEGRGCQAQSFWRNWLYYTGPAPLPIGPWPKSCYVCDTTTQPLKSKDDGRGGGPKHNLGKIILKKSRPKNS